MSYHESRQAAGTNNTVEMGRLAQSSPSDNESSPRGFAPTAPLPSPPPLQDNNGYATDDTYERI